MNQIHDNQTSDPSPYDRPSARRDALCAFWKTVHEAMREGFDYALNENGVEVYIKPFRDFMMAAIWEESAGLTLFAFNWDQSHQDFSPPSYLNQEHVQWIVEVAGRRGIRYQPDAKAGA